MKNHQVLVKNLYYITRNEKDLYFILQVEKSHKFLKFHVSTSVTFGKIRQNLQSEE